MVGWTGIAKHDERGVSMQIPDLTEVETWRGGTLSTGVHHCVIETAEEGKSSGGHPELKVMLRAIESDPEAGAIITDWINLAPDALGRMKQFLDAVALDSNGGGELDPEVLIGRPVRVTIGPHRTPSGSEVMRVKGYHLD